MKQFILDKGGGLLSERASKFARTTIDQQLTDSRPRCWSTCPPKEPIVHMTRSSYTSLHNPQSVPTRNTVSTCESKTANTPIYLQLLLFETISICLLPIKRRREMNVLFFCCPASVKDVRLVFTPLSPNKKF